MANFHLFEVLRKSADQDHFKESSESQTKYFPCVVCDVRNGKVYRYDTCMTDEFIEYGTNGQPIPKNDKRPLIHLASIPEDKMVYFQYADGKKTDIGLLLAANTELAPDERNRVRKAYEGRYGAAFRFSLPSPL